MHNLGWDYNSTGNSCVLLSIEQAQQAEGLRQLDLTDSWRWLCISWVASAIQLGLPDCREKIDLRQILLCGPVEEIERKSLHKH